MRSSLVALAIVVLAILALSASTMAAKPAKPALHGCMQRCKKSDLSLRFCSTFCKRKGSRLIHSETPIAGVPLIGSASSEPSSFDSLSDSANNDMLDPSKLWAQYRTVLMNFFRQGDDNQMPYLQLVTNSMPAEWDQSPELLNELCNRLPKMAGSYDWSGRSFDSEYEGFLHNLNLPKPTTDPAMEKRIREWEDKLWGAENEILDAEERCMERYDQRVSRKSSLSPTPFDTYKQQYCITSIRFYQDKYVQLSAQAEQDRYTSYGKNFDAYNAIDKFKRTATKSWVAMGDVGRFARNAEAGTTNAFNVKVTSKTTVKSEKESSMNIGITASIPVYQIEASLTYSKSKLDIRTKVDEFQIELGAGGYKYLPVMPNREWFSPDVLSKYAKGPFKAGKDYFGKGGSMPLLPKGFFVVVKPKISMFVSAQDAQEMTKTSQLGLKVSIMGIGVDFGKNDRMKTSKETDKLYKIEIDGNDPAPQLLAVDNWRLGEQKF